MRKDRLRPQLWNPVRDNGLMDARFAHLKQALAAEPSLRLALVFGSVASGSATPDSDIDVAVLCDQSLSPGDKMRLIEVITQASGRAVDLIDLSTAGQPLLGQILRDGQRIVGSSAALAQLATRNALDAQDFLPYVQRLLARRRQAWIG